MYCEITCPKCGARAVISNHYARKIGGFIGAIAGAATGLSGARNSSSLVVLAGTLMSVLLGATAGCSTGTILGSAIDDNVLNNFRCSHCGKRFSQPQAESHRTHLPELWSAE